MCISDELPNQRWSYEHKPQHSALKSRHPFVHCSQIPSLLDIFCRGVCVSYLGPSVLYASTAGGCYLTVLSKLCTAIHQSNIYSTLCKQERFRVSNKRHCILYASTCFSITFTKYLLSLLISLDFRPKFARYEN